MSIVWMSGNVCVCMCGCMCACVHVCTYVGVCMGVCALVCGRQRLMASVFVDHSTFIY